MPGWRSAGPRERSATTRSTASITAAGRARACAAGTGSTVQPGEVGSAVGSSAGPITRTATPTRGNASTTGSPSMLRRSCQPPSRVAVMACSSAAPPSATARRVAARSRARAVTGASDRGHAARSSRALVGPSGAASANPSRKAGPAAPSSTAASSTVSAATVTRMPRCIRTSSTPRARLRATTAGRARGGRRRGTARVTVAGASGSRSSHHAAATPVSTAPGPAHSTAARSSAAAPGSAPVTR